MKRYKVFGRPNFWLGVVLWEGPGYYFVREQYSESLGRWFFIVEPTTEIRKYWAQAPKDAAQILELFLGTKCVIKPA